MASPETPEPPDPASAAAAPMKAKRIHLNGFLKRVEDLEKTAGSTPLLFLLGAGASKQSGIKTGGEMVADWLEMLRRDDPDHESVSKDQWATPERVGIDSFNPSDPAASYPDIFDRTFLDRRPAGFDYLEREIAGREPSFGYSVLAQILDHTRHKIVITTNFDNLVVEALSIYTASTPLVCGHESLAGFIRAVPNRPQIVKVHRDLFYSPRNSSDDLGPLPERFAEAIRDLFKSHIPVVIGYGGNDGSLMGVLEELEKGDLAQGLYWCYWDGGPEPGPRIQALVSKLGGWLVPIAGFDELMIKLMDRLKLDPLDAFLEERGVDRAKAYKENRDRLAADLTASAVSRGAVTTKQESAREASGDALKALKASLSRWSSKATPHVVDSLAKMQSDPIERAKLYESGLASLPKSAWMAEYAALFYQEDGGDPALADHLHMQATALAPTDAGILGNYANFLRRVRGDHDAAEAMYKRALEADPRRAAHLNNYATFLTDVRRDHDAAQAMYKQALEADPRHANTLGNYANFLRTVRQDHDAAEAMYKRALEADPRRAAHLNNYATFLTDVRGDHDAAEAMFKQALEADPHHANTLGNYANFLRAVRQDHDAAELMYKCAIQANPRHGNNLGNYALFLTDVRGEHDAAETMHKRALEADPRGAGILNNYALFLTDVRKDHDAAEAMYKRALEADPRDGNNLSNYANFLRTVRQDHDAAEAMYKRALEAEPRHAGILGNYATFLMDVRKDHDAAEGMYKRAIEIDPSHAITLGNYACLLLSLGRLDEGLAMLDRAIAALPDGTPIAIHAECWMYAYCHRPQADRPEALQRLRQLIEGGVRTGSWDFSGIIEQAVKAGHTEAAHLPRLAEVLADRAQPASLSDWPAWQAAASS